MIDINRVRRETDGCNSKIHFNNAGCSLMPQPVVNAINDYLLKEINHGGYEVATNESKQIQEFYTHAGNFINAKPSEIAYVENATRGWNTIFLSLSLKKGDRVITSTHEYGSNYLSLLYLAKKNGVIIDVVSNNEQGEVCLNSLKNRITTKTKLITITHVPSNNGLINPAAEIGALAEKYGIFYLLDATQSLGQIPINIRKIKCDALCATGRKYLRGPRGTGFIYIKQDRIKTLYPPFIELHSTDWVSDNNYYLYSDNRRFETSECNYANKIGLSMAIQYASTVGIDSIWRRVQFLSSTLREKIISLNGILLHDTGIQRCGLVTFSSQHVSAETIYGALQKKDINVSICWNKYARIDMKERKLNKFIRVSLHYYNTEDEINYFIDELEFILSKKETT
jgi:cysteine desulfurase/selenocysteine lyase